MIHLGYNRKDTVIAVLICKRSYIATRNDTFELVRGNLLRRNS